MKDNILVLYSGGMGSFLTANLIKEKFPHKKIKLYFNDTLMESDGLYNFLLDTLNYFWPVSCYSYLKAIAGKIPQINREGERKQYLLRYGNLLSSNYSNFVYDPDGRNIWEVFDDVRFIGNSQFDPCSNILKRQRSQAYVSSLNPETWDIAIGIDYTEIHRWERAVPNWKPFDLIAPLIEFELDKHEEEERVLEKSGIKRSSAYERGFGHDNCGGFCVKAGLGHFKLLLEKDREKYLYHEKKEAEAICKIGRHPFLRKAVKGTRYYLTMKEYRVYLETGNLYVDGALVLGTDEFDENAEFDVIDFGGCGCAI